MTAEAFLALLEELAPGIIIGVGLLLFLVIMIARADRRPRDPPDDP